jgi:predicted acyltransferase
MATAANPAIHRTLEFPRKGGGSGPKRLLSLDVLRGVTIAFMSMVNNTGGSGAWREMRHAEWNGFTATDLVFPTFLFVVGVSIVFSTEARLKRGASRRELAWHAVRRACILFLLGIVVNGFPHFQLAHLRFYGVLQRIAICYLIVELFYLWDRHVWTKAVLVAATLIGYWILVQWVPVPGAGVPGRDVALLDKDQNIVAWVDRQLMPGHLYEDSPAHNARDPEGLLSDIPAVGTTLIGLLTGLWLFSQRTLKRKTLGLAVAAGPCLALGYFWAMWLPLNKKMWTSSYVLVAAGWSLLILAFLYWLMEERGWGREGAGRRLVWPWLVFGTNAIIAYMISELLGPALEMIHFDSDGTREDALHSLYVHIFMQVPDPGWRAFVFSAAYTAVCFVPVWMLYRKKIFVKI